MLILGRFYKRLQYASSVNCTLIPINRSSTVSLRMYSASASDSEDYGDGQQKMECGRHAVSHTDMKWPDFSKERRSSVQDSCTPASKSSNARKIASYLPVALTLTAGLYAAKTVTTQFIMSMAPAKDVLSLAQVEVKLSSIAAGTMMTVKWRGKPLFIKHRLAADIQLERQTPLSILRHPERDEDRVQKPEWLIVIGVCTHLGCIPISNAGDYNAFYCPCHGSHYDHSGRIRKGPAPTNLEVPPYVFLNDETILVG